MAVPGLFAAEALRRKKEREGQIEDYYRSRPVKVEQEGKGGRLTGGQIARAYQNAMNQFKAKLQQAQTLGMSAEQAEQLEADVAASGKIGASLGAAKEYIARLEEKIKDRYRRPADDQPPPEKLTPTGKIGLVLTGVVMGVAFSVAEISLAILAAKAATLGPGGVAFDVLVVTPVELFLIDTEVAVAVSIYKSVATGVKQPVILLPPWGLD